MALFIPQASEVTLLQHIVNKLAPTDPVLRLFTNNVTPGEADTAATYTEASGFGYAAVTCAGSSWTTTAATPSTASFAQQTFTFTGALGNVYGYFFTKTTSGLLLWVERFVDGPYGIANNGDAVKLSANFTLD